MNPLVHIYLILFISNRAVPLNIPVISDIQDIVSVAHDLSDLSSGRVPFFGGLIGTSVDPTMAKIQGLSTQISELTEMFNIRMDKLMSAVLTNVPRSVQLNNLMSILINDITRIDEMFDDYEVYVHKRGEFNRATIDNFIKITTSHDYGDVQYLLKKIYHIFVPGQLNQFNENILDLLVATLNDMKPEELCGKTKSQQQRLYDVYETVVLTEIKGFIMTVYSYGLLSIYNNSTFTNELDKAVSELILRCNNYLLVTIEALEKLPRQIFLCDPKKHVLNETYFQLERAIRMIVIHESMVSESISCSDTCGDVDTTTIYRNYRYSTRSNNPDKKWSPHVPCKGRMHNCQDIGRAKFCELPEFFRSRYFWIDSDVGFFGPRESCWLGTEVQLEITTPSFWKCSTCLCQCSELDADSTATRAISLRPQLSNIKDNMVVTGVRFELKDNLVHVQIEQGKLKKIGQIDTDTVSWVELEDFVYLDDVSGGGFAKIDDGKKITMKEHEDFSFVRYGQRDFNLDDIYAREEGYTVTGVRFNRDPNNERAIQLEVHITPANFSEGLLIPTEDNPSKWLTPEDMPGRDFEPLIPRTEVDLTDRNDPTQIKDNIPDTQDNSGIWFTVTNKWQEIGENTIPFFDKQLVSPHPKVALDGIGVFHRGTKESGGFLSFKVFAFDLPKYLNPTMTPENIELFENSYDDEIINHPLEPE
ncbi:uncharacterized protein LOC130677816 [Microplitis mediator]|uniref:uncharacterized protein LOC130677816 n=1 Tax=Microplitis mediator TaxID=375433 RepID=UPI0025527333|nr:uncharacterized protein LOC130677816 [Microplitis mediator]